jgi:hypothetical protein
VVNLNQSLAAEARSSTKANSIHESKQKNEHKFLPLPLDFETPGNTVGQAIPDFVNLTWQTPKKPVTLKKKSVAPF